jgi:ribosomal protein S18 acetylase RimI-like enzyme
MQQVEIIPARPEHGGNQLADLIWTDDVHLMQFLFKTKDNWRRLHLVEWPNPEGFLCYGCARAAMLDGRLAGVIVSHDPLLFEDRMRLTMQRWQASETSALMDHVTHAMAYLDRLFPHLPDDSFFVLDLAVDSRFHGKGIGKRLLKTAEADARALGRKSFVLDVNDGNPAVDFYRHCGMEIAIETKIPVLARDHGIGVHYRMVKELH